MLPFELWVPLVASSKDKTGCCVYTHASCRLGNTGGDHLARLVDRGVDGSPRVKVQHARMVYSINASY